MLDAQLNGTAEMFLTAFPMFGFLSEPPTMLPVIFLIGSKVMEALMVGFNINEVLFMDDLIQTFIEHRSFIVHYHHNGEGSACQYWQSWVESIRPRNVRAVRYDAHHSKHVEKVGLAIMPKQIALIHGVDEPIIADTFMYQSNWTPRENSHWCIISSSYEYLPKVSLLKSKLIVKGKFKPDVELNPLYDALAALDMDIFEGCITVLPIIMMYGQGIFFFEAIAVAFEPILADVT